MKRPRTALGHCRSWPISMVPLLLIAPQIREAVEARMVLQMAVLFPAMLASGWAVSCLGTPESWITRSIARYDWHGLLGVTVLTCVTAVWMLPAALDLSRLGAWMYAAKLASWWIAGALFATSWPRLRNETLILALGNIAWMTATAGLLYQTADVRICVSYLLDDQEWSGAVLIAASVLLLTVVVRRSILGSVRVVDLPATLSCGSHPRGDSACSGVAD